MAAGQSRALLRFFRRAMLFPIVADHLVAISRFEIA